MSGKQKPGGVYGTEPGFKIDTRHYPSEDAAWQRGRLLARLRRAGSVSTPEARGEVRP